MRVFEDSRLQKYFPSMEEDVKTKFSVKSILDKIGKKTGLLQNATGFEDDTQLSIWFGLGWGEGRYFRDHLQISLLILSKFKQIN